MIAILYDDDTPFIARPIVIAMVWLELRPLEPWANIQIWLWLWLELRPLEPCFTNIEENISSRVEYQHCETRSIWTSMSKPKKTSFPPFQWAQSHLIAHIKEHPILCLWRMRNVITNTHTRNFLPAFAKPRSPREFRKASALKGPEGTTYTALGSRFATVSLSAQATF